MNEYFDKIFYINLDKDVDRNEHMLSEFNKAKISNYERFPGVAVDTIPCKCLWRNFNKEKLCDKYILGGLGARASHVGVMKLAKERGYKRILILEDDVAFALDPNMVVKMNQVPDWDMIYLGGRIEHHFRHQIVGAYAYGVNDVIMEEVINMADTSGMEIDNFYAKVLFHMSYNYKQEGKYRIIPFYPFESIVHTYKFATNIQK